ncbi:hypothetical protein EJB05_44596 [Eragrostis curvula]|uniref:GBF-interacting protein 1 N-terminal domain-containing protein n=1 Tax=Eragrostis curvula TaxID=38414 RepID=A0A5J9TIB5_9POAL|nr:hypothetical protein EJB05_44596 [Eragrostis curvula]
MAAARVSIPAAARRMIQDIKEIAGGHADEEVYAVLRECDMDPNEAAQRLLNRGTFHEVKRKRDKKKESRKESADPRWRPGVQGRDIKGGQGTYSSRQLSNSNDLSGKKALPGKEIGVNQNMDKGNGIFINRNMESKSSTSSSSLSGGLSNGPSQHVAPIEKNYPTVGRLLTSDSKQAADLEGTKDDMTSALESVEAHSHDEICLAKHDSEGQQAVAVLEVSSQPSSVRPSASMPSSSYRSHSQQLNVSHKAKVFFTSVVANKAWNPKSASKPTPAENVTYKDVPITVGTVTLSVPVLSSAHKEDLSLEVDKRLTEMQLSDKQHVIIPDHLQVTESEKYGLSFGSFGNSFERTAPKGPECEKSSDPPEEDSSHELHELGREPAISCQGVSSVINMEAHKGVQQLSVDDSSPQRAYGSSETLEVAGSDLAKDSSEASHVHQDSAAQTPTSYSTFALAPQNHGSQTQLLETSESQVHEANDFSASHHTQLYQPIANVDAHISPFAAPGAAPMKYGNIPVSRAQTSEAQEGINSFVVPSTGSSTLVPAASGAVPSSMAIPQPPVPIFRQPVGVQVPHYAPSFIPYNHYISPLYYPPHTLNHFMGNAAVFPQLPSTGSMYPPVSAAGAPPAKYASSLYKPDDNTGNQTHVGVPGAYAVYGSSPSVYTNNAVVTNGASVETDDAIGSQFKENNGFVAVQQNDGSTVWIPAPGHDVSLLQPTSFYGMPTQGQHLAFTPAQAGPGVFRGMYHPAQTLAAPAYHPLQSSQTTAGAVEMAGPPASGYQQSQQGQMNWGTY